MGENINVGLQFKQQQKLVITPMMQQALKILQLSTTELIEYLEQEMSENPMLEETEEKLEEESEIKKEDDEQGQEENLGIPDADLNKDTGFDAAVENQTHDFKFEDWQEYLEDNGAEVGYSPKEGVEGKFFESKITFLPTLQDHLLWQLRLSCNTEEDYQVGELLIGNIDEQGYLQVGTEEVALDGNVSESEVLRVLALVQSFEPAGIAARDLKESLLIQLKYRGLENSWTYKIVESHLADIQKRNFKLISKKLGISLKAVEEAAQTIVSLEPKPGLQFASEEPQYVIPDVLVEKAGNEYVVLVNEGGMPRLRLSTAYRNMLLKKSSVDSATKRYLEQKLQSAIWLIRSIEQRRKTIYRVTQTIVKIQKGFFEYGISYLKPLTLKQIADEIQMHESTVSRVTTNKYVQTPRGILELKFFFTSKIEKTTGEASSSLGVKEAIREIIENESKKKPLSDERITLSLKEQGFKIARRTVSKYREELKILSTHQRRRV